MHKILLAIFKTGSGSLITLLLGMITTKIFAVGLGTNGVGLLSLLRQTRDTIKTITTLNGQTALVQGLASRKAPEREQYASVVFIIMLSLTGIVVVTILVFAPQIALSVLNQQNSQSIALVRWLSVPVVFTTSFIFLSSILNGYRAIGRLAIAQISSVAITVILAYPVVHFVNLGYPQSIIGMMTLSAMGGVLLTFYFIHKARWGNKIWNAIFSLNSDRVRDESHHFLSFAATTLITGLASSGAILLVRSMIVAQSGMDDAGVFDVAWTLSMMYVTLALSSFGTYYLPTLSQLNDISARQDLIQRILRLSTLTIVPLITAVIALKPIYVRLLYSEEFSPALQIIRWMLIGDYLKTTSWVFGVTITAFADKKALLWSELLWQAGFLSLSSFSLFRFKSLEGIGAIFALMYLFHLSFTFYYAHTRHGFLPTRSSISKWLIGFLIIIGASLNTWTCNEIHWPTTSLWLLLAFAYAILSISRTERKQAIQFVANKVNVLIGRQ